MPVLVLGLGNPILGDDGVGWRVVEEVERRFQSSRTGFPKSVEFDYVSLGGLALMERLIGYERAILVDAIQTPGGRPGDVYRLALDDLPTAHADSAHDASLKAALELGRRLGAALPADIALVAIEAARVFDFGETLSSDVQASVPAAAQAVLAVLASQESTLCIMEKPSVFEKPGS